MKNLKALYLVPLLALLTAPAMAHHKHDGSNRIENRLDRQELRIDRGVRNGELTRHEAQKLRKRHRKVERMFNDFYDDGRLNKKERSKLNAVLDKNSKKIKKLKHNDRQRPFRVRYHDRRFYDDREAGNINDDYTWRKPHGSPLRSFVFHDGYRW